MNAKGFQGQYTSVVTPRHPSARHRLFHFAAVGALSGVLHGLTWPNFEVVAFNAVFFVPFLLALPRARTVKEVLALSLSMGAVATGLGFYWLSYLAQSFGGMPAWAAPSVVLLYALVGQGQFVVFALAFHFLQTRRGVALKDLPLLTLPAFYLVVEFFYPKIFCDTQGAMLYRWKNLIQICEITGVWGLTFLVIWFNSAVARCLEGVLASERKVIKSAVVHFVVIIAVLAAGHLWGGRRIVALQAEMARAPRTLKTKVIQANIGDADKLASEQGYPKALKQVMNTYADMSRAAVKPGAPGGKPDLLLWPETSYPLLYTHFMNSVANERGEAKDEWLMKLVEELGVPLYFGGYSSVGKQDFNSAWLVSSRGEPAGLYQKHILLAFGETVPLGPLAPLVHAAFPAMGNFGRGPGPATGVAPGHGPAGPDGVW